MAGHRQLDGIGAYPRERAIGQRRYTWNGTARGLKGQTHQNGTVRRAVGMRVLVTGTEGYLGSLMAPLLLDRGHDVIGVDTGFYRSGWLCRGPARTALTL